MNLQTYRLTLVPDPRVPLFRRLHAELVDVPVAAVFATGVHPHSCTTAASADPWQTIEALLDRLNADDALVPDLRQHGLGYTITAPVVSHRYGYYGQAKRSLADALQGITETVALVPDLTYRQLLELATARLRDGWCHGLALEMLKGIAPGFAAMRECLKRKRSDLKLTGYDDLDRLDLATILAVDDFLTEDRLLLNHGLPLHNFRRQTALAQVVDRQGRLRLTERFDHCQIGWHVPPGNHEPTLRYSCAVRDGIVTWQPSLTTDESQRRLARNLAQRWGNGSGRYCFTSPIATLAEALADEHARLTFPSLVYGKPDEGFPASAQLVPMGIACYAIRPELEPKATAADYQEVLRAFSRKVSGRKQELATRIAQLLTDQYAAHRRELDRHFQRHRYLRLPHASHRWHRFPVLADHPLQGLLLGLYALRHLRGNTILEARHRNESVELRGLAEALLDGRVRLDGQFVAVL